MKQSKVEIVLHVDDELGFGRQQHLVDRLQSRNGVGYAHFTPGRPHLMVVDYDPNKLHALDVLGYVHSHDIGASLVGGI